MWTQYQQRRRAVVKQAVRLAVVTADESLASTAPRLASARRLKTLEEAEARQLALRYQLMSPHTAYFVLAERDEKARERAMKAGVVCYLAKPFNENELLDCIQTALNLGDTRSEKS